MRITRPCLTFFLLLFFVLPGKAQVSLRLSNGIRPAVEKVLGSYSENFRSIEGDTLSVTANSTVFNSTVKPEGAIECTLTKFWTNTRPDYSWKAIMFETDDFDVAVKKYSTCYQQLKNTTIRSGHGNFKMEGEFESTDNTKNFYSTIFTPATSDPVLSRLRMEILLEGDMTIWKLSILVYERIHDDKEGSILNGK
ncbi:MAG: hypothetical protein V4717_16390 [Bacteroidota bacterium]